MEEFPRPKKELSKEEAQDAQIGLLEWELEERDAQHGVDHLTGLKTRKTFERELDRPLKLIRGEVLEHRAGAEQIKEISLIFIDLDNFKRVNDILGHTAGDNALKKVAEILTGSVREADIVARFGGDEFYILLPRANEQIAMVVAEKVRANLDKNPKLKELGITASLGVCSVGASSATNSETLIHHADLAAKKAKQEGKNRVEAYSGA